MTELTRQEKAIIVNVTPEETRMALVEGRELVELAVERQQQKNLVGNIYKGRIQNVLPGMQAAFVDIGFEKNAFLYIGDGLPQDAVAAISHDAVFSVGQSVLVQVVKDAIGTKGPRATTHLTLPGRYVVLMPTVNYIGISRRIEDPMERERLRKIAEEVCPHGMGMIVRTVAEKKSREILLEDVQYLLHLWKAVSARAKVSGAPTLLYRNADLLIRIVRDYLAEDVAFVAIDDRESYQRMMDLLDTTPQVKPRMQFHAGPERIFTQYGLYEEIEKIGRRELELPSGGFIVIDKTEALTVIDVNTGKFVGRTNLSDTVFQTNCEAAKEIAKQLRLRDIGGIIIVDFIDMDREEQKRAILKVLEEGVKADRTKTNIVGITGLGLVEITRKKSRQNFEGILYSTCPCCGGQGRIQSPETVAIRICRDLRRAKRKKPSQSGYLVQMHPQVAEYMERSELFRKLKLELGFAIRLERASEMHPEAYAILQDAR